MVVTFDTMVMIWGVKKQAHPDQQEMIDRTARFLDDLRSRKISVVLTSTVVAEYLGDFSPDERPEQYNEIIKNFPIEPFDLKAAGIAAEMLYNKRLIKELQGEYGVSRQVIKADIAIVASAIAAQVDTLYSNDGKYHALAKGKIIVKPIPDTRPPPKVQHLFPGE